MASPANQTNSSPVQPFQDGQQAGDGIARDREVVEVSGGALDDATNQRSTARESEVIGLGEAGRDPCDPALQLVERPAAQAARLPSNPAQGVRISSGSTSAPDTSCWTST
jgi:hypothetical protein